MHLRRLRLRQFRAHEETESELAPGVNLFVGLNGAGKTNLLEAVGYLCLGKSVLATPDAHVVQRGAPHVEVEGVFGSESRGDLTVRVVFVPGEGKRAFVSGAPLDRLADLVGRVPFVFLSPADHDLTAGGPSERRRFLDATLSQAYPVYLDDLLKYRRALKQKNALLQQARRGRPVPPGSVDAWDEELAVLGGRLVERRRQFLDRFVGFLDEAYRLLDRPGGALQLEYAPSAQSEGGDEMDVLRGALGRSRRRSLQIGRTLVGPHLDEVEFAIDGFELRPYASQGQHRTFALAVRLAQALFLRDHRDETPILLLDDVFGPLDPDRAGVVLELLASRGLGQSLVTAARPEPFRGHVPFEADEHRLFHVERGEVSTPDPSRHSLATP
jgi:DNA replication and repair protein RecF